MTRKWDRKYISRLIISCAFSSAVLGSGFGSASLAFAQNQPKVPAPNTAGEDPVGEADYFPAIDGARGGVKPKREIQPVFYSARRFSIPFSVAATGRQPVEVQLLISRDGGENWQAHERARPEARSFAFAAEEDGNYWFSLRTIDERGMAYPNQNEMLHVIIDSQKPDLGLAIDMNHAGEMEAECSIGEPWIDTNSVVLEYQTDDELKWVAIPVEFKPGAVPGLWGGKTTWQPSVATRNVMVRLTASDRAGNKAEVTRMFSMPRTAVLPGGMQLASQRQGNDSQRNDNPLNWSADRTGDRTAPLEHTPGASPWLPSMSARSVDEARRTKSREPRIPTGTALSGGSRIPAPKPSAIPGANDPARMQAQWESSQPASSVASPEAQFDPEQALASSGSKPSTVPPTKRPTRNVESGLANRAATGPGRLATTQADQDLQLRLPDTEPEPTTIEGLEEPDSGSAPESAKSDTLPTPPAVEELPPPEPMPEATAPALTNEDPNSPEPKLAPSPAKTPKTKLEVPAGRLPVAPEAEDESGALDVPMNPHDQNTFYSRSKAFSLDYSIDVTRGSSVSAIELWGTMDGGKSWSKWGEDEDRESPFDITVEEEGLFGFRVVIVGSNLVASNQPRAGDPADAWIYVDAQTPDVKIISAVYGVGNEAGNLVIEYTCNDDQLIDRPISISFSDRRDGPWTTVASGLKNTGRYLWPAEPNLPKRIYLRIEAVDKAANIGVHRLDVPVDVEGLAPRGRIKGFRPIEN